MTEPPQLATRISPRVRQRLDHTIGQIKAQGEAMTIRGALEEAIDDWCDKAARRYALPEREEGAGQG